MPNTAVKPANAESTWMETSWEDRKPLIQTPFTPMCEWCFFARGFLSDQVPGISSEPVLKDKQGNSFEGPQGRAKLSASLMHESETMNAFA